MRQTSLKAIPVQPNIQPKNQTHSWLMLRIRGNMDHDPATNDSKLLVVLKCIAKCMTNLYR